MDSENECSALESVDDSEAISPNAIVQRDDNLKFNNGSYVNDSEVSVGNVHDSELLLKDTREEDGAGNLQSPTLSATPDGGSPSNQKGVGLKKWRRFKRDHIKDANHFADSSKMLKRGLSTSTNNQSKPQFSSSEMKQPREGSIGSENTHRNFGLPHSLAVPISIPDTRFAVGSGIAGDSDCEDRGSKFSTAASGPKTRQPRPGREKSRVINTATRSSGSSVLQFQSSKGRSEGSKKLRGAKVNLEEENSLSSLESDSVNSNFVFAHAPFWASDNGKQGERGMDYGGENDHGAHELEKQNTEEAERGNGKVGDGENHGDAEKYPESRDQDCLADSMLSLQSVQEALGREVEKLGTIGREATTSDCSIDLNSEISRQRILGTQVLQMAENEKVLERKLEESTAMLEAKELRITQLQAEISDSIGDGIAEVDDVLKLEIEAEVEYMVLTRTMKTMKEAFSGPAKIVEEQKALVEERVEMIQKLGETESKAMRLGEKMKELERNEDVEKMESRVCKVTFCFLTELVLLVLVLWAFVLELLPEPGVIVPT